ncbi:GDSL esterase/lipase [Thecamonas trahens ATCC 50062]|uniref:GDSL esterase/lipase n=1 Tax=Thecamonas trahens ATCC 50062 TaxID=461836 RepID=A0A0L0D863_THETB|nr:GDSL esterase/lipase [Thecamonas trahens ATCC 50062]KNC47493.1 GDSL esterase/lipase [Thecamonas trahens ATCC 50062]|eukprot:XP_013759429.1 GDSL esterase/lipase [Thecamonas trahens ATCC 50062]
MADEKWETQLCRVVAFGDSITQEAFENGGWGARLVAQLTRRGDVVNRGFSGYNTEWAVRTLDKVFPVKHAPQAASAWGLYSSAVVTVFFGANDASTPGSRQAVPVDAFVANLRKICLRVAAWADGSAIPLTLVVIGCPPVHREQRLAFQVEKYGKKATGVPERSLEMAQEYAAAAMAVANELALEWAAPVAPHRTVHALNLCELMLSSSPDNWSHFLRDGLHLSRQGNEFVYTALSALLPHVVGDHPLFFPHHSRIDAGDVDASFDVDANQPSRDVAAAASASRLAPAGAGTSTDVSASPRVISHT